MTTDEPVAPRTPSPPQGHNARNLLLIVAGFVSILGVIAGGTFFYFYDRSTAIDRGNPEGVVVQFLDAALHQKDPGRASLFTCGGWPGAQAMAEVDAPTDPRISITWGDIEAFVEGKEATVTLNVFFFGDTDGGSQRQVQAWTFDLENQDGWRVCGLVKDGSL